MVKAIKGTNLELFDMNQCDDIDATVDGGDVLYTGLGSNNVMSHKKVISVKPVADDGNKTVYKLLTIIVITIIVI